MTTLALVNVCLAVCVGGSGLALAVPRRLQGNVLIGCGCLAGVFVVAAALGVLLDGGAAITSTLWSIPGMAALTLRIDSLAAVFLLATGLVLVPASIYAGSEMRRGSLSGNERSFTVMLLWLYASIVVVLMAGDALLFLLAWEIMSILCYLLIASDRRSERDAPSGSGYLLLAMGEAGTIAAAVGFLLLALNADSMAFDALKQSAFTLAPGVRWAIFLLTFFGFGVKAGLVPVNSWLQRAYAAAPAEFAPVLAGATLNLGLYGILRVNADLLPATTTATGLVALVVGTASALIGILYATTDNDLKAVLAHSSIENVGIVVTGAGAGAVFLASHHPALAAIAFVASLYHLVNHSLYKTMLFIGVGTVEKQTGTRDMDRLGGLLKLMPFTGAAFLVGTLAIAGLPPLNGFVSEWLTLQGLLRAAELGSVGVKIVFALCGAGLALTAALAVTCFVKVFAMSFLGMRRLDRAREVNEAAPAVLGSMGILAVLCLTLGGLPTYVISLLTPASVQVTGVSAAAELVPPFFASAPGHDTLPGTFTAEFHDLGAQVGQSVLPGAGLVVLHRGGAANPVVFAMSTSYMLVVLAALLLLVYLIVRLWLTPRRRLLRGERWAGGIRRLLPDMTYTATGFSNPVRVIFDAIFRPTTVEDTRETVAEHFRNAIHRERTRVHLVDRTVFGPIRSMALGFAHMLARMHHGRINAYAAYALIALALVLVFGLALGDTPSVFRLP